MEYLVTMTTHVPDGTSEQTIDGMRAREAKRSHELAELGHLVRLWRPPLQPGEWRTLALFVADDDGQLEEVLRSMPLRVWRTDEVTPLRPHSSDPVSIRREPHKAAHEEDAVEFLTSIIIAVADGSTDQTVDDTVAFEADRARELAEQGFLLRLWSLPGEWRTLGLWQAPDAAQLRAILESLPLYRWMTVQTTALTHHPNDPAISNS